MCTRDAYDQAGCRKNSVIGSKNSRPEPAKAVNRMTFRVFCRPNHFLFPFAPAPKPVITQGHCIARTSRTLLSGSCDCQTPKQERLHRIQHKREHHGCHEHADVDLLSRHDVDQ